MGKKPVIFSAADAITEAYETYKKNFHDLFLIAFVSLSPSFITEMIPKDAGAGMIFALLLFSIVSVVTTVFYVPMIAIYSYRSMTKKRTTIRMSIDLTLQKIFRYLIISVLSSFLIFAGLILCIVPGIFVSIALYTAVAAALFEKDEISPLKLSKELASGHYGEIFLLMLIGAAIMLFPALFDVVEFAKPVFGTISLFLSALAAPLVIGMQVSAYKKLRAMKFRKINKKKVRSIGNAGGCLISLFLIILTGIIIGTAAVKLSDSYSGSGEAAENSILGKIQKISSLKKSGDTLGNLGALKSAAAIYYGDNRGKWPQTLDALVPNYIDKIPGEAFTGSNKVLIIREDVGPADIEKHITGDGGWIYVPSQGDIYLNLKGEDAKGRPFYKYGFE